MRHRTICLRAIALIAHLPHFKPAVSVPSGRFAPNLDIVARHGRSRKRLPTFEIYAPAEADRKRPEGLQR